MIMKLNQGDIYGGECPEMIESSSSFSISLPATLQHVAQHSNVTDVAGKRSFPDANSIECDEFTQMWNDM